ncbi:efflux RND transporter permease subunit [Chondromyces crocatus]|uniref:RND transporter n=1 Tax=Chondromyces crocatus TaxID=52 RepID=A0A0K1EST6_CHOCO|nr:efflux RND transporter permease subunit [Chondromyces crocatus]AKT44000.1 RND transporter [Chondromyces crocatus]
MSWLTKISVRRPVLATVLMLVIVVLGAAGYAGLGLDQFPNVDAPVVVVTTRLDGAAPEEVEADITDKIESAVNTISGIDELRSTSSQGISQVVVVFTLERETDGAVQDVRDKMSTILPELPKGVDPPVVSKLDIGAAPVLLIAVRSDKPIRETTEIADKQVRRQIESIQGVGQVTLIGGQDRQVNLWLDALALRSHGMTAADVQRALMAQNLTTPGGSIETGPESLTLRVAGRVTSLEDLGRIVLREQDGHAIRVKDVARVEDGRVEEKTYAALEGERTVLLSVVKQSGQNTVTVVDAVKARLDAVQGSLPGGTTIEVVRDNSQVIRTGIEAVLEHLVLGALLAALVVLVFLGSFRSTVIAALAIPISIVGTFAVMWIAGFTLNFLTLLALALAVGIVIDDAIVVLENIVRFIDEKGMKPFPAAVMATKEIGPAVMATTLSLMAVFIPVSFMPGIAGRFLRSFGLTMAFSIAVSLFVSFTLTPMLAARWISGHRTGASGPSAMERVVNFFYKPIERGYVTLLSWVMRHRWVMVVACAVTLGSCVPIARALPSGFLPEDDQAQFEVSLRAPEGTSLTATRLIVERIAEDIHRLPGVTKTLVTVGEGERATNVAKVYVMLTDPGARPDSQSALMQRVRQEILAKQPPELRLSAGEVQAISVGGTSQASIQVALMGPDLDKLGEYATRITEALREVPAAVDVDNTLVDGKPEVRVAIDRDRAADLGVQVADVASTLQLLVGGLKVSSYAEGGEEYDVRIRADAPFRMDADALSLVNVPSSKHGSVPLANVVSMEPDAGPAEIGRLGRRRQITVMANSAPGAGDSAVQAALDKIVADQQMPDGYTAQAVGRSKNTASTAAGFVMVIGLAFVFMYLILAAQFESWLHPVTILLSLPLTVPFALLSLLLFGQTLNMFSALGLLVLFGVVKKNAILQIDHTNHLRREGKPRLQAIIEANKDRLRPILMTTLAFVAGMIPLVASNGVGSGQNRTMGAIVLGGQSLSLLLTLLAVPVAYSLFDDAGEWLGRLFRREATEDKGERELDEMLDGASMAPAGSMAMEGAE